MLPGLWWSSSRDHSETTRKCMAKDQVRAIGVGESERKEDHEARPHWKANLSFFDIESWLLFVPLLQSRVNGERQQCKHRRLLEGVVKQSPRSTTVDLDRTTTNGPGFMCLWNCWQWWFIEVEKWSSLWALLRPWSTPLKHKSEIRWEEDFRRKVRQHL